MLQKVIFINEWFAFVRVDIWKYWQSNYDYHILLWSVVMNCEHMNSQL